MRIEARQLRFIISQLADAGNRAAIGPSRDVGRPVQDRPATSFNGCMVDPAEFLTAFGLTQFRAGQREVIEAVLANRDCLCVMPTGGGKSLCYQLPAVARDGVVLVISPLIALMKDQVDGLRQRGLRAACINSTMSLPEQDQCLSDAESGEIDLLYIAPERFRSNRFQSSLDRMQVQLLAIDEAHCISEWGHDFRPDYARLGRLRKALENPPTIALTATATQEVRDDIARQLELDEPQVFVTGFARDNLSFEAVIANSQGDKDERLIGELGRLEHGGCIVYCNTRKTCEAISERLSEECSQPVGLYHAGLPPEQRSQVQDQFMSGELDVIVATNAFGMGIDRSDLRLVVHYNVPGTLEAYYQEAGRAGRDGQPAHCLLLFGYQDRYIHEFFIDNAHPSRELLRDVYEYLRTIPVDPIEVTQQELREQLGVKTGAESVGAAEQILERHGAIRRLSSQQNRASVWIETDAPDVLDLTPRDARVRRKILKAIVQITRDARFERATFTLEELQRVSGLERESLNRGLRELTKLRWFDYAPPFRGRAIHVVDREQTFQQLDLDFAELARRKQAEYDKLDRMIHYAQSRRCRQVEFLRYFGQRDQQTCGRCDNCRKTGQAPDGERDSIPADALRQPVRMALSGVARARGAFGKSVVAQMLCGSRSTKMSKWGLDRLSTFGLFEDCRQSEIGLFLDELIRVGAIEQVEVDRFRPVVKLTAFGRELMRGEQSLQEPLHLNKSLAKRLLRIAAKLCGGTDKEAASESEAPEAGRQQDAAPTDAAPADGDPTAPADGDPPTVSDADIFENMRRWRRDQAEREHVPAYRILPNAVLQRLVETRPADSAQLAEIPGIGPAILSKYGDALLQLVNGCMAVASTVAPPPPRDRWTWELLNSGYSVADCLAIRRISAEQMLRDLAAAAIDRPVADAWLDALATHLPSDRDEELAALRESSRRRAEAPPTA